MRLTAKQEAFAVAYIKLGNATAAYREAYGEGNWSEPALNVEACRLLKHPKVSLRIKELIQPVIAASELTVKRTLEHIALAAYSDPTEEISWGDKLNALDKAMKHLGMFEKDNNQRAPNLQMQINLMGAE